MDSRWLFAGELSSEQGDAVSAKRCQGDASHKNERHGDWVTIPFVTCRPWGQWLAVRRCFYADTLVVQPTQSGSEANFGEVISWIRCRTALQLGSSRVGTGDFVSELWPEQEIRSAQGDEYDSVNQLFHELYHTMGLVA